MDTNTILLIGLGVVIVLSAVAIWLANRGSGITPQEDDNLQQEDDNFQEDDKPRES